MSSPSSEDRSGSQQSAIRRNTQNSSQFSKDLNTSTPPLRSNANSPSGYTSSGNNSNFNPPASQFGQGAGNGPFNRGEHQSERTEQQERQHDGNERGSGIGRNGVESHYQMFRIEGKGDRNGEVESGTALVKTPSFRPSLSDGLSPIYYKGPQQESLLPVIGKDLQPSLTPLDTLAARSRREGSDGVGAVYGVGSFANLSNGSLEMSNSMTFSALSDNDFGSVRSFISPSPSSATNGPFGAASGQALIHSASSEGHHGSREMDPRSSSSSNLDHQQQSIPAMSHLSSPSLGHHSDNHRIHSFPDPPSVMSPPLRSPSEVASSYFGRDGGSRSNSGDGPMPQDGRLGDGGEGERVRGGADSVGHASSGSHHRQDVQQQHQSEGQHQKSERDARDNYEGYGYGEHHQRLRERELSR